jgi:hypothetical protein
LLILVVVILFVGPVSNLVFGIILQPVYFLLHLLLGPAGMSIGL